MRKPHGNSRLAKIARPVLATMCKGGAPKGNKNALRHGRYTAARKAANAEFRARLRNARAVILRVRATVKHIEAMHRCNQIGQK